MKTMRMMITIAVSGSICLLVNGQQATDGKDNARDLPGWGTVIDPDGDCHFDVSEETLHISVPSSVPSHDLDAEVNITNAPRVLQSVNGDFTIQVRTEGIFAPGNESTHQGRSGGYNGAGLVAMVDDQNVVTLARAALQRPELGIRPYANFEIRVAGKIQRYGSFLDLPLPIEGPVFLRLERRGSMFLGAVSTNGINWEELEPKMIPLEWPRKLQTGVVAISSSKSEFNPRFSKLQVFKSPFEIVLIDKQVEFSAAGYATNNIRPMELLFRNVGDTTMGTSGPASQLSIVWDGKEYMKDPNRPPYEFDDGGPFSPMSTLEVPFSPFDFLIPQDALTAGWHTVSAKAERIESNPVSVFLFEGKKY